MKYRLRCHNSRVHTNYNRSEYYTTYWWEFTEFFPDRGMIVICSSTHFKPYDSAIADARRFAELLKVEVVIDGN